MDYKLFASEAVTERMEFISEEVIELHKEGNLLWCECVTQVAEEQNIEVEDIAQLLSPVVITNLYNEAVGKKTVRGEAQGPTL